MRCHLVGTYLDSNREEASVIRFDTELPFDEAVGALRAAAWEHVMAQLSEPGAEPLGFDLDFGDIVELCYDPSFRERCAGRGVAVIGDDEPYVLEICEFYEPWIDADDANRAAGIARTK